MYEGPGPLPIVFVNGRWVNKDPETLAREWEVYNLQTRPEFPLPASILWTFILGGATLGAGIMLLITTLMK